MLIYDLVDPAELNGFLRALVFPEYGLLNGVLPSRPVDDLEYRFTQGEAHLMDVAPFRAFDAEAPIGTRGGLRRMAGELPPLSKKMRLGEEQRLRLRQLQGGATGAAAGLVDQIFRDAENLARSLAGRLELACGDALVNGKVTIAENGVAAEVDYGYTGGQKPTRATAWTTPSADILGEELAWVEAYADRNGGRTPGYALVSPAVRNAMLRNDTLRNYAYGRTDGPAVAPLDALAAFRTNYDLPPLRVYDTRLPVGGVTTRVIPQDRYLLLPGEQVGATFTGTTAEAIELAGAGAIRNDLIAGMTAVVEKTFDPVSTWTKVSAIALPVLYAPEAVTSATVL